jgi:hypothetical protein
MQAAADATALMLSQTAKDMTPTGLNQAATNHFSSLFQRQEVSNVSVTPAYTTGAGLKIVIAATGTYTPTFVNFLGVPSMTLSVASTVQWGGSRLRVALVLDNTGSMAQSDKMTALQTATKNLLSQLQSAVTEDGDVYVSIVPFVKDVNVGSSNYTQTWIDWTEWDADNGSCSKSSYSSNKSNCTSHAGAWTPANHSTWNGCVMDRGNSGGPSSLKTDTNVTAPTTSNTATLFPAEQYQYCPKAATMALSNDWSTLSALVDKMTSQGSTNQAIGLALGWMSLVGGGPFPTPPAMDPDYTYQQVIILLTDGLNTQDRWYGNGSSTSTQVDARQQITCDNINAAKITLYAVQVNTDNSPTSTLLQNCAGSPNHYPDSSKFFLLTSADEIITTFQQIGTTLLKRRLTQ